MNAIIAIISVGRSENIVPGVTKCDNMEKNVLFFNDEGMAINELIFLASNG